MEKDGDRSWLLLVLPLSHCCGYLFQVLSCFDQDLSVLRALLRIECIFLWDILDIYVAIFSNLKLFWPRPISVLRVLLSMNAYFWGNFGEICSYLFQLLSSFDRDPFLCFEDLFWVWMQGGGLLVSYLIPEYTLNRGDDFTKYFRVVVKYFNIFEYFRWETISRSNEKIYIFQSYNETSNTKIQRS